MMNKKMMNVAMNMKRDCMCMCMCFCCMSKKNMESLCQEKA